MFAEIEAAGCIVNNLFQLTDGTWRCNLRFRDPARAQANWVYEYSDAPTPEGAVMLTLRKFGCNVSLMPEQSPGVMLAMVRFNRALEELNLLLRGYEL